MNYAAALSALLVAVQAYAQLDRRSRDEPEMFIEAGGRSGTCDALVFSPDGKYLFVAGDDKTVRVLPVGGTGLQTGRMTTLRWPAWREQRGGIKTLAVPSDPADRRVFVAGYGMMSGLAVTLDMTGEFLATNELDKHVLPATNVMASAFASGGKSVVYGTADGRLWQWDFAAKTNTEIGRFDPIVVRNKQGQDETLPFNRPRLIRFLSDGSLVSAAESGQVLKLAFADGKWKRATTLSVLESFEAYFRADGKAPPKGRYRVYRTDLSHDGKWLACSLEPNYLVLCPLEGGVAKVVRVDFVVRSVAFDRGGRLAVAETTENMIKDGFPVEGNDRIRIYEDALTAAAPKDSVAIKHTGRAEALAWGPNSFLAVAGGDNHEVTLYDLKTPIQASPEPLQVVRGHGRGLWQVRIGSDGESFVFRPKRNALSTDPNERGDGPWVGFNFATGERVEPKEPVGIRTTADGWSVRPSAESALVWQVVQKVGDREIGPFKLPMDPDRDEQPRCFCFLPAKGATPTRLLVGHYYGFSMFALDPKGIKRTSLATGHAGDVMSIATDADGTWCVTCGMDQTIGVWNLKDWPHGPFGAELAVNGDKLVVKELDEGGPAWEMGLLKGDDVVFLVQGGGEPGYALPGTYGHNLPPEKKKVIEKTVGTPQVALDVLKDPTSGVEYYLAWKRPGQAGVMEGLTTVRRRPVWRFFPAFDAKGEFDNWVAWMWKTGHYATSTNGDFLVGWQLNDPETITKKKPAFFLANRFHTELNKQVAILRLMQNRDLGRALRELAGNPPQRPQFGKREPHPVRLDVGETVGPDGMTVRIGVSAQGRDPDYRPQKVELWVNDYKIHDWPAGAGEFSKSVAVPANAFRSGENRVTVLTFNPAGGRGEAQRTVTRDRSPERPRLYGLLVGINDYSNTPLSTDGTREFGQLDYAQNDASKLGAGWKAHVGNGRQYAPTNEDGLVVRLDPKTPKEILDALQGVVDKAGPDDLVVVFLAGHGDFVKMKGVDEPVFVYCCPNYDRKKFVATGETGLTGTELFGQLAKCKARKLVLLDACHSGQAASENLIRHLVPEGQGPTVIAACDQKEQSFEDKALGHGLFTAAVLQALGPNIGEADTSKDGMLDAQELFDYLRGKMPALLKAAKKPQNIQNPQSFPVDLARFPIARK
jgi:WD40 repeat protein